MLDKKYLKELHNMNQDIKKVFETYYVFNTGIILNTCIDKSKGVYVESDLYKELYQPDKVIMVNSILLFEIFKKYKISQIEGLEVREGRMIGAIVNGQFEMFAIYKPLDDVIKNVYNISESYIYNKYEHIVELTESQREALLNKESISVILNDRRIILCKSVISTIKKKSLILIESQDKMVDNIFYTRLKIDNSSNCIINHTFRCLNV